MTIGYVVTMTVLSIRFKRPGVYERLKRDAARRAESISSVGERLIDEGLRMEVHPGIVFRDGPSGPVHRAGRGARCVGGRRAAPRGMRGSVEEWVADAAIQLGLTER